MARLCRRFEFSSLGFFPFLFPPYLFPLEGGLAWPDLMWLLGMAGGYPHFLLLYLNGELDCDGVGVAGGG